MGVMPAATVERIEAVAELTVMRYSEARTL